jgi:drug/metabolite transporter (DMT)-like permease
MVLASMPIYTANLHISNLQFCQLLKVGDDGAITNPTPSGAIRHRRGARNSGHQERIHQMSWPNLSLLAMLGFVGVALIIKKLTITELRTEVINFYFFLFTTIVFLGLLVSKGTRPVLSLSSIKWFALLAIVAATANYFSVAAIRAAPNPGYVTSIRGFEAGITALVAVVLFKSEITATRFIGIVLMIGGLILVSLAKS